MKYRIDQKIRGLFLLCAVLFTPLTLRADALIPFVFGNHNATHLNLLTNYAEVPNITPTR